MNFHEFKYYGDLRASEDIIILNKVHSGDRCVVKFKIESYFRQIQWPRYEGYGNSGLKTTFLLINGVNKKEIDDDSIPKIINYINENNDILKRQKLLLYTRPLSESYLSRIA